VALVLDTGPLFGSIDRNDASHPAVRNLLRRNTEELVIPGPVLVEAEQLITSRLHPRLFIVLLDDILSGGYHVEDLTPEDYIRVRQICAQYADSDIGFVDAAVLAIVERLGEPKLATLDHRHFGALRPRHVASLTLLPQTS
jgi:predicted nucleic acid-binding protein